MVIKKHANSNKSLALVIITYDLYVEWNEIRSVTLFCNTRQIDYSWNSSEPTATPCTYTTFLLLPDLAVVSRNVGGGEAAADTVWRCGMRPRLSHGATAGGAWETRSPVAVVAPPRNNVSPLPHGPPSAGGRCGVSSDADRFSRTYTHGGPRGRSPNARRMLCVQGDRLGRTAARVRGRNGRGPNKGTRPMGGGG